VTPIDTPLATSSTLRKNLVFGGAALILVIMASESYELWQDYRAALAQGEQTIRSLSHALADETQRTLKEFDAVLAGFARTDGPLVETEPPAKLEERLQHGLITFPGLQSAAVVGTDGHLRASTGKTDGSVDWSASDAFIDAQNAARPRLYIGVAKTGSETVPKTGNLNRDDTVVLSRGLIDLRGDFAGLVVARVGLGYLSRSYAAANAAPGAAIRLLRNDGVVLCCYPDVVVDNTAARGREPPASGNDPKGLVANDERRMAAQSPVSGYPIAIEVTQPMGRVLAYWHRKAWAGAERTGILVLAISLFTSALATALRRRERWDEKRLRLERQSSQSARAESLGMFAASIAHDFNNVLGAIVGYAELAREGLPEDSPARKNIERLLTASERARQLVRRVLTFDLGRSTRNARLEIEPIAKEVLDQVRATLPVGITLRMQHSPALAAIQGDSTEIHQVLMNLCSNAVRAMPKGGILSLAIDNVTVGKRHAMAIGEVTPGQWIRVSVTDDGVGMSPAQLSMIFEPFTTTKHVAQGAGIGLAVVNNIVTSMGGAIGVESQLGYGSTFSVFWPTVAREEEVPAGNTRSVPEVGRGEIIMIVDDDPILVEIAEELIAALGYEPIGFTDPERALAALRQNPAAYDALISDQRMSSTMRGTDLARAVRACRSDLPIMLMTGHRDAHLKDRAEAAGVREILDKPLRSEHLKEVLARLLPDRTSAPAPATAPIATPAPQTTHDGTGEEGALSTQKHLTSPH
jgi:signal transduction histidine kinase/CheY-like chemotaxis protein